MTPTLTDAEVATFRELLGMTLPWDELKERHREMYRRAFNATYALALSRTVDREREAAKRAWEAAREFALTHQADRRGQFVAAADEYLARTYPVTPEPVVLSDGSVVRREIKMGEVRWTRSYAGLPVVTPRRLEATQFTDILNERDTGADFDKLKALAATLTEPRHD